LHMPSFLNNVAGFKAKRVDSIAVTGVNDVFVMEAWKKATGAEGKIEFLADGNGEFAKAIGAAHAYQFQAIRTDWIEQNKGGVERVVAGFNEAGEGPRSNSLSAAPRGVPAAPALSPATRQAATPTTSRASRLRLIGLPRGFARPARGSPGATEGRDG